MTTLNFASKSKTISPKEYDELKALLMKDPPPMSEKTKNFLKRREKGEKFRTELDKFNLLFGLIFYTKNISSFLQII